MNLHSNFDNTLPVDNESVSDAIIRCNYDRNNDHTLLNIQKSYMPKYGTLIINILPKTFVTLIVIPIVTVVLIMMLIVDKHNNHDSMCIDLICQNMIMKMIIIMTFVKVILTVIVILIAVISLVIVILKMEIHSGISWKFLSESRGDSLRNLRINF